MIVIETDRLYFREILKSDDHNILELDSDPDAHQYLGNQPIKNIIQARDVIQFIRQQYVDKETFDYDTTPHYWFELERNDVIDICGPSNKAKG